MKQVAEVAVSMSKGSWSCSCGVIGTAEHGGVNMSILAFFNAITSKVCSWNPNPQKTDSLLPSLKLHYLFSVEKHPRGTWIYSQCFGLKSTASVSPLVYIFSVKVLLLYQAGPQLSWIWRWSSASEAIHLPLARGNKKSQFPCFWKSVLGGCVELSWHSPPTNPCVYFPVLPWAAECCRHHAGCQLPFHLWSLLAFCPSPREILRLNQFLISMEVIPVLHHGEVPPACVEDQLVEMRALPRNLCVVMMLLDFVMPHQQIGSRYGELRRK